MTYCLLNIEQHYLIISYKQCAVLIDNIKRSKINNNLDFKL